MTQPPPPGYPPQQPPAGQAPNNYLVLSIVVTLFCCLIPGIVAIVKASQVNGLWAQGRYGEAQALRRHRASKWAIWSIVLGAIGGVIYIHLWRSSAAWPPRTPARRCLPRCSKPRPRPMVTRPGWVSQGLGAPLLVAATSTLVCTAIWVGDPTTPNGPLPVCPTKALLGIDCPGCGSLRMLYSASCTAICWRPPGLTPWAWLRWGCWCGLIWRGPMAVWRAVGSGAGSIIAGRRR